MASLKKQKIPLSCILLVDDDNINNFINLKILKKIQASDKVQTALNGEEALDYIKEFCPTNQRCCPQLIFLDINMPVMNGFEFLQTYNRLEFNNKAGIKIVVLTTSTNQKDIDKIRELGIQNFINKPLTEEKVKEVLCFE